MTFVIINYKGTIYKVEMSAFESIEEAYDRGWYIATKCDDSMSETEKVCLSHMYLNEKVYCNKYD